jgi:hypothetical protein
MQSPLIAIVGSANPNRSKYPYEPPLRNVEQVPEACAALGRELALTGHRIIVYTSSSDYIEADVVSGYVASGKAKPKSIQVRYPNVPNAQPDFKEQKTHPQLFDFQPEESDNWQAAFVPSLRDADGIVILGGGNSALITGLVAQAYKKPMVSIATFGGSSLNVWKLTAAGALATPEERKRMNLPGWQPESAAELVKALADQRERLRQESLLRQQAEQTERLLRQRELRVRTVAAAALLVATAAVVVLGITRAAADATAYAAVFFLTPIVAGATGGVATDLFDYYSSDLDSPRHAAYVGGVLGAVAGFFSAFIFYATQQVNHPADVVGKAVPPGAELLLLFVMLVGFTAGFTMQKVFLKWRDGGTWQPPAGGAGGKGGADK